MSMTGREASRKHFTWITDLPITLQQRLVCSHGRPARWRIENETFNTLKNQGYHYEHNFGHGQQNLSVVFAMLMMLAFLVDQTQTNLLPLVSGCLSRNWAPNARCGTICDLTSAISALTRCKQLYEVILYDLGKELAGPVLDTSRL